MVLENNGWILQRMMGNARAENCSVECS